MFAIEALSTQVGGGTYENSEVVKKACGFIVSKQEPDGGWSENIRTCEIHTWVREVESPSCCY